MSEDNLSVVVDGATLHIGDLVRVKDSVTSVRGCTFLNVMEPALGQIGEIYNIQSLNESQIGDRVRLHKPKSHDSGVFGIGLSDGFVSWAYATSWLELVYEDDIVDVPLANTYELEELL